MNGWNRPIDINNDPKTPAYNLIKQCDQVIKGRGGNQDTSDNNVKPKLYLQKQVSYNRSAHQSNEEKHYKDR